jgi:hypothetical protein
MEPALPRILQVRFIFSYRIALEPLGCVFESVSCPKASLLDDRDVGYLLEKGAHPRESLGE